MPPVLPATTAARPVSSAHRPAGSPPPTGSPLPRTLPDRSQARPHNARHPRPTARGPRRPRSPTSRARASRDEARRRAQSADRSSRRSRMKFRADCPHAMCVGVAAGEFAPLGPAAAGSARTRDTSWCASSPRPSARESPVIANAGEMSATRRNPDARRARASSVSSRRSPRVACHARGCRLEPGPAVARSIAFPRGKAEGKNAS